MGGRSDQQKAEGRARGAEYNTYRAGIELAQREWERNLNEEAIQWGESMLGSDAQLYGTDPDAFKQADYLGGYFAPDLVTKYNAGMGDFSSKGKWWGDFAWSQQAYNQGADRANALLEQAQAAAAAGDFALADSLKAQADAITVNASTKPKWYADNQPMVPEYQNPAANMSQSLKSPMGMTAGYLVRRGREYADPDSAMSQRLYEEVRDPLINSQRYAYESAVSTLAAERRQAEGQLERSYVGAGGARNLQAERAVDTALRMGFAQQKADLARQRDYNIGQLTSQTNMFLEQYRNQYAAASIDIGRAYLRGSPFFNETYNNAMDSLAASQASLMSSLASFNMGISQQYFGSAMQKDAGGSSGAGAIAGALQGAMSGASTGAAFGPWGALIGGIGGAVLGGASGYMGQSGGASGETAGNLAGAFIRRPTTSAPSTTVGGNFRLGY